MSLETFLNPEGEDTAPDEPTTANEVLDMVIEDWQASIRDTRVEEDDLDDDNFIPTPSISTNRAVAVTKELLGYGEAGEALDMEDLRALKKIQSKLKAFQHESRQQTTLDQYFS